MKPRPYQLNAVDGTVLSLFDRPILVSPTGSGKTFMGTEIVRRLRSRALWVAHRRELVNDAYKSLNRVASGRVGVIMGKEQPTMFADMFVASVQTLRRRSMPEGVGLIFIDECHHAVPGSGYEFLFGMGVPVIGLTATPFRLDGRPLGDLFGELVVAAQVADLVDDGYLMAPKVYSHRLDLRGVQKRMGDYNKRQLAEAVRERMVVGDLVREWHERAYGKRTVCFATDVAQSQDIVTRFREAGVAAEHLDGMTPTRERDDILARLRSGETTMVSNCMVLTEGWDLPALECGIFARPTASLSLHLQMVGRIMRSVDGKSQPIALDHAGNFIQHGPVTRRLEYSLQGDVRPKPTGQALDVRRCGECGFFYGVNESACPECGHAPEPAARGENTKPGELDEFRGDTYEVRLAFWIAKEDERIEMDYQPGWSLHQYRERFGDWPLIDADRELINPGDTSIENKQRVYDTFAAIARTKKYAEGWVRHRYHDVFGVWPRGIKTQPLHQTLADKWRHAEGVPA